MEELVGAVIALVIAGGIVGGIFLLAIHNPWGWLALGIGFVVLFLVIAS